jgi:hypothetical protein
LRAFGRFRVMIPAAPCLSQITSSSAIAVLLSEVHGLNRPPGAASIGRIRDDPGGWAECDTGAFFRQV